ncbi:hypothetical protein [Serratia liquefaciens]|uniref:hypothetical protein n=1 Tax=Serratia liquefaciens TaxID=614 RepID=UPI001469B802|nr:hypothetical protein [Serratia liquefaciens]HBL6729634.1 hypothetical protein [Serratia liquefaciens]HEJ7997812.1 hypothetical protein [Serratia liquefaciens]
MNFVREYLGINEAIVTRVAGHLTGCATAVIHMGIKVVSVSPKFANYSKSAAGFGKETTKPRWTYLNGEHQETINAILRRQLFDRLLGEYRGAQR